MTSVLVWVGVDSRGPSSVYIATDSRFAWRSGQVGATWDRGRKTFSSLHYADIAGFWGDVLFPISTLSQHFSNLDSGAAVTPGETTKARFQALERLLRISLEDMPTDQRQPFTIVQAGRDGEGMTSEFQIRTISWNPKVGWRKSSVAMPTMSSAVHLGGSGAGTTRVHLKRWQASGQGGTSRAVYSAFVDGLNSKSDPWSGGPPQLVGIYRIGSGRSIGTVVGTRRFLNGAPVAIPKPSEALEWRNELFERVSGETRHRLPAAQRHERA